MPLLIYTVRQVLAHLLFLFVFHFAVRISSLAGARVLCASHRLAFVFLSSTNRSFSITFRFCPIYQNAAGSVGRGVSRRFFCHCTNIEHCSEEALRREDGASNNGPARGLSLQTRLMIGPEGACGGAKKKDGKTGFVMTGRR
ncbi:hypothetical protein IWZ01DRAFT_295304 [Phyllosticta capitalensis]